MAPPPPIIGPIIGGLASLAGGFMSNNANADISRSQNRHNERMLATQNRFNLEMWNRQNAYNTPREQRKRYEEAGINPYLALGNITAGTAQGVTSAQAAPAVGYHYQDPVAPAINTAITAYTADMQAQKIRSERDLLQQNVIKESIDNQIRAKRNGVELENVQSQTDLNRANASRSVSEKAYTEASLKRLEELTPLEKQRYVADIQEAYARVENTKVDTLLKNYELSVERQVRVKLQQAQIYKLYQDSKLSAAQVLEIGARIALNEVQADGINLDNQQKESFLEKYKERLTLSDEQLKADLANTKADTSLKGQQQSYLGTKETMLYVESGIQGLTGMLELDKKSGGRLSKGVKSGLKRGIDVMKNKTPLGKKFPHWFPK